MLLALVGGGRGGEGRGCLWPQAPFSLVSWVEVAVQYMPLWPYPHAPMQVALLSIGRGGSPMHAPGLTLLPTCRWLCCLSAGCWKGCRR